MSVDYAAGLSHYDDLGVCGLDERFEDLKSVKEKTEYLAGLLRKHKGSSVVHVGAGLSTSAGIPDFRGKNGVWTKLLRAQDHGAKQVDCIKQENDDHQQSVAKPFDETTPTRSHMVLRELCRLGFVRHIVSQNVDGLFLKSGMERNFISELHGNFYLDECTICRSRFIRGTASPTMRLQKSGLKCPREKCKGNLRDTILDWESPVPHNELRIAERESRRNKLHICIGTSLQLRPSKDLVCNPAKRKAFELVVINLQPIQIDARAQLVINHKSDLILEMLADNLNIQVPEHDPAEDPTKNSRLIGTAWRRSDHDHRS